MVKRLGRKISGGGEGERRAFKNNVRDNSMIRCGVWGKQSGFRVRFSGRGSGRPAKGFLWYDEVSRSNVAVVVDVFACSCVSRVREFSHVFAMFCELCSDFACFCDLYSVFVRGSVG